MFCVFLFGLFSIALLFFNDPATTDIYPLSLHDALPISALARRHDPHRSDWGAPDRRRRLFRPRRPIEFRRGADAGSRPRRQEDRKSTRLNSSHVAISYAVFCLKKKKKKENMKTAKSKTK